MEKLIQVIQVVHAYANAVAWLALGGLLFVGIGLGIMALFWIFGGGAEVRSTREMLTRQRLVAHWLRRDKS